MIAIYCRISQEKEEGRDKSIKEQKLTGITFANSQNKPYKIYTDEGVSGTLPLEQRPGGLQMLNDLMVKGSKFTAIWTLDTSRLHRGDDVRFKLLGLVRKYNLELYYGKDLFDWNNPQDKLLHSVLSAIDAWHVDITKQKVKQVFKRKAEEGQVHGLLPLGYTRDANKKMIIKEQEADLIRRIFQMKASGKGYRAIATILNREGVPSKYQRLGHVGKWGNGSIHRIINNRHYIGERIYGGSTYPCPAIVDIDTFKKANVVRRKPGRVSKLNFLLNERLTCGKCGKRYTGRNVRGHYYYRCTSGIYTDMSCKNPGVQKEELDYVIWEILFKEQRLKEALTAHLNNTEATDTLKAQIKSLKASLKALEVKKAQAIELTIEGTIDKEDIKPLLSKLNAQIESEEASLQRAGEELKYHEKAGENLKALEVKDTLPYSKKKEIVETHIKQITLSANKTHFRIAIEYNHPIPMDYFLLSRKYDHLFDMKGRKQIKYRGQLADIEQINIIMSSTPDLKW